MKQLTFAVLLTCLSLSLNASANGDGGDYNDHRYPVYPVHPRNMGMHHQVLPSNNLNASATATGIGIGGGAAATGVNGNISPTQHTTVSTGPQTNQLNGSINGTLSNKFDGSVQGTNTGTFQNDGRQSVDVQNTNRTGDVSANIEGGNSAATQSQTQGQHQSATGSGNVTKINYDAPKIPVATAATLLLPPVVCASSSSGLGVQTQMFGFNFGSANSRERCWQSKEATECVNLAIATSTLFGMRRMMAQVAVGCTIQSPSFRDFAKEMGKEPVDLAKEIIASYGEEQKVSRDEEYSRMHEQLATEQSARKQAEAQRDALTLAKEAREAAVATPSPKTLVRKDPAKRAAAKKVCPC